MITKHCSCKAYYDRHLVLVKHDILEFTVIYKFKQDLSIPECMMQNSFCDVWGKVELDTVFCYLETKRNYDVNEISRTGAMMMI